MKIEMNKISLKKYINENNLKAAVILRNERDGPHWFMPLIGKK